MRIRFLLKSDLVLGIKLFPALGRRFNIDILQLLIHPLDIIDIVPEVQVGIDVAAQVFSLVGLVPCLLQGILRIRDGFFAPADFILQVGNLAFDIADLAIVAF